MEEQRSSARLKLLLSLFRERRFDAKSCGFHTWQEPAMANRVEQVTADEVLPLGRRHVLDALMQLYLHDFSEHALLSTSHGEVGEDGRFTYPWLDTYWQESGRVPLLIRVDGRIAGFVLVNQWSALDRPLDHAIAEFFVLRKYRRARVGARAAHLVFRHMPGHWEVPVASYNHGALAFWRRVVDSLPYEVEERVGDGQRWAGTVLCFDNRQHN